MKRLILFGITTLFSLSMMAQNRVPLPANWRTITETKKIESRPQIEYQSNQNSFVNSSVKVLTDLQVGTTAYDLQTNDCVDSRCYLFPDGTVGTTWTFGTSPPSYPERGTGYNYFDGTAWGPDPTVRIEDQRTGWPSYAPLGPNDVGEVVISHNFSIYSLIMNIRNPKGTGSWAQYVLPKINGTHPAWPRVCTNGNTIHVLCSDNDTNVIINGMKCPTYYYRSTDGGATWDINQVVPAGLETYTEGFGGDEYAWAKPHGDTIAFVIGDMPTDMVLMKSTDAGATWTKTVIFQNPHPYFDYSVPTDTMYVTDGHYAIEMDPAGNANVVFGIKRVLNVSSTSYSIFTLVNGLGIWKEGEPTFSGINGLNVDDLDVQGKLVAWVQDHNGDGTVFENFISGTTILATFRYGAPVSQPQLSIDANGDKYVVYTSTVEDQIDPASNCYYNHLWGRKYFSSLGQWGEFRELTAGGPGDYDFTEQIFPSLSKTMNNQLHIVYQYDLSPGAYVEPYSSPGTIAGSQNVMMYLTMDKSDLLMNRKEVNLTNPEISIYPNPITDYMNIQINTKKLSNVTIQIYNSMGGLVKCESIVTGKGECKLINVSNLATGIYLVKVETEGGVYSKKIVKQ
jgi:hypothetical protein